MAVRSSPEGPPAVRFDLTGQVAVVTGAARGLGSAIALALAQAGADVVLGLRERASGEALAEAIRALGRRALPVQMDIRHRPEIRAAIAEAIAHFGRIDILVNNAGIGPPFRSDLLSKIPLGRVGEPADVCGAVVFLASPAAALINGATLLIDGGFTAH